MIWKSQDSTSIWSVSRLGPNDKVGGKVTDFGGRLNMVARGWTDGWEEWEARCFLARVFHWKSKGASSVQCQVFPGRSRALWKSHEITHNCHSHNRYHNRLIKSIAWDPWIPSKWLRLRSVKKSSKFWASRSSSVGCQGMPSIFRIFTQERNF